jgi:hypothetical protein
MTITADVDGNAAKGFGDIGAAGTSLTDKLLSLDAATNLISKAWSFLSGVASTVFGAIKDVTSASMEASKAERDLVVGLRLRGAAVDEALPRLRAFAAEIQRGTGIGDDAVLQLQAHLLALRVLPQNLEAATVAAIGWSKTTGKDMTAAATDVVKVLGGKFTALQKVGIQVKDTDEAIRKMAEGFQFAVAEGRSLEGRLKLLA